MTEPFIEHDPDEPKIDRSRGPWLSTFVILSVGIAGAAYYQVLDWASFMGGVGFGGVLAGWAIERTGNKIPESWRSGPAASRRPKP